MDEIVKQAMLKWPNVPACAGWLGLDARGHWFMRDDAVQQAGAFPASKGAQLQHEKLAEFIGRNYSKDGLGRWYFQNGPQRVFVELEAAPWVIRMDASGALTTHTGLDALFVHSFEDELGRVFIDTNVGLGLLHSLDMLCFSDHLEQHSAWQPSAVNSADLPAAHGFVLSPLALEQAALADAR
ncbi:DUF2946 family protein [Lampropedia aestuarii]|uniref:DUF2946 family protein n=1 Tax=Lampropedia aestuarii TaxID=2562762 RepID=A0A4S5BSM7_9BURK|nr:DUF2946 family protein [Lampropedia aestuarii]MDH5859023.1 DUF2946 family protein [Lampropedia aestuarii]THJ32766.1 DUF2946 family protein [Lampropedia aestuarii]